MRYYLDLKILRIYSWVDLLKVGIRRNDAFLKSHGGLYKASQAAGSFKMPDVGFKCATKSMLALAYVDSLGE
jgi:hypothetical protein